MKFKGLGVAMVTPMNSDGSLDFDGLKKLTNHLVNNGCDYLVVQGTTGESPTLSFEEKLAVLDVVIETNAKRIPVVFGVGGNNTKSILEQLKIVNFLEIDGILTASPAYNKPSQRGIVEHYKLIADNSKHDIILYNVPGRTSSNMTAETTLKLAKYADNIVAIKEASGNMAQIMSILRDKPQGFEVISGDDPITFPMISLGSIGVISVVGNAYPKELSNMVNLCLQQKFKEALPIHNAFLNFTDAIFQDGNPGGVKEALNALDICKPFVRLPLVTVDDATKTFILHEMKNFN